MKLQKRPPPGYYHSAAQSPTTVNTATDSAFSRSRANSGSTQLTSPSTAPTSPISPTFSNPHHSCSIHGIDAWLERNRDDLDNSDELPTVSDLNHVGDIPIYDADGNSRPFKSIYQGNDVIGERQLVVFVRHFYCGACQAYLKALTRSIDPETYFGMAIPTSITIIGCGSPSLIPEYKAFTGTAFPIFAEPTRALYKGLGMGWTLDAGKDRPEYMRDISKPQWLAGQVRQVRQVKGIKKKLAGGNPFQIGGEFLFSNERPIWCHRMENYRDHAEVDVVRRVLEID